MIYPSANQRKCIVDIVTENVQEEVSIYLSLRQTESHTAGNHKVPASRVSLPLVFDDAENEFLDFPLNAHSEMKSDGEKRAKRGLFHKAIKRVRHILRRMKKYIS